jgi:4-hydroxyproline epimerase
MRVVDSHTAGEPTRLIVEGGPPLGPGSLSARRERFAREFDSFRRFAVNEPRGSDALVGALLCEPQDKSCAAGLIFFNNVGYLQMCGHATIGACVTLAHLKRIGAGAHRFETPVGVVRAELIGRNEVAIDNVPSYRFRKGVRVEVEGLGPVIGDVAWGGNWFFLTEDAPCPPELANVATLTQAGEAILAALARAGVTGRDGARVDHLEFFASSPGGADSRNFVLCPGGAYDRSPCGTGLSAKLACLAADGKLKLGASWIQESVIGSRFVGSYREGPDGAILPRITGSAFVTAEATLLRDADDPFRDGIAAIAQATACGRGR